ncbi:RHS repeat-associated core domain-containing protein [bacterium]|nr:RHS repeat-associated core domain-containing protein [bacterium]
MSTKEEYNFTDIQGSAVMTADALTGEITSRHKYDPYGNLLWANIQHQSSNISEDRYSYTGKELNSETGLVYFGARWYDGDTGRFVSTDKGQPGFGNPQTINRYHYCLNNPVNMTDPDGNDPIFNNDSYFAEPYFDNLPIIFRMITNLIDFEVISDATQFIGELKGVEMFVDADGNMLIRNSEDYADIEQAKRFVLHELVHILQGAAVVLFGAFSDQITSWEDLQGEYGNLTVEGMAYAVSYHFAESVEEKASAMAMYLHGKGFGGGDMGDDFRKLLGYDRKGTDNLTAHLTGKRGSLSDVDWATLDKYMEKKYNAFKKLVRDFYNVLMAIHDRNMIYLLGSAEYTGDKHFDVRRNYYCPTRTYYQRRQ